MSVRENCEPKNCPFRSLTGTETGPVDISDFIDLLDKRLREAGERYLAALYEAFGQEHLEAEHHKECPDCPDTTNKQEILKMLNFAGSFAMLGKDYMINPEAKVKAK